MNLIALLIGLVIERLATRLFHWRRMRWLDRIIDTGFRLTERLEQWPALIPVVLLAIVLVLPVFAIIFSLGGTLHGFTYLILAVFVVMFSIGPKDIGGEVTDYCTALESEDEEQIQQAAKAIIEGDVPSDARERVARVEEAVCVQANNRLFAVIFWFVVLGPFGPLGPLSAAEAINRLRYPKVVRAETVRLIQALDTATKATTTKPTVRRVAAELGSVAIGELRQLASNANTQARGSEDSHELAFFRCYNQLEATEDLDDFAPPLTGRQIMTLLGMKPGRLVGEATKQLHEWRIEHGPLTSDQARSALDSWWTERHHQ